LWRGQEKGAARIGNTGKPFDEPMTQKTPALRVALRRAPAASPCSTVLPIRPSHGSWRIASPQRNAAGSIWSQLAQVHPGISKKNGRRCFRSAGRPPHL